jgi:hypothetical protein
VRYLAISKPESFYLLVINLSIAGNFPEIEMPVEDMRPRA